MAASVSFRFFPVKHYHPFRYMDRGDSFKAALFGEHHSATISSFYLLRKGIKHDESLRLENKIILAIGRFHIGTGPNQPDLGPGSLRGKKTLSYLLLQLSWG
jgi:hypothetical protein